MEERGGESVVYAGVRLFGGAAVCGAVIHTPVSNPSDALYK